MVTVERSPAGAVVITGSSIEVDVLAATPASVVAMVPPRLRVAPTPCAVAALVTSARTPLSVGRDEIRRDSLIVIGILFVCHQLIRDRRLKKVGKIDQKTCRLIVH